MALHPNRLLAFLPRDEFERIRPRLRHVEMRHADILAKSDVAVKDVYFPHSGVISLVVQLLEGYVIETAMIGKDGVLNAFAALDGKISLNMAIVQTEGTASAIEADALKELAAANNVLRSTLIRHEQVLFAQAEQAAACNASHDLESRMCRWLLRMQDLIDQDELRLTQEFLSQMVGVTRSSVSIVAGTLQRAGLIEYKRGHIRILNVDGVREASCECYGTIKGHYDMMYKNAG